MYYVYAHFKKDTNELFYIGVAKSKKRFLSKYSRNNHWNNIVKKHDFYYKIIYENNDWKSCLNKEIELISLYGRQDLKTGILVNLTDGGEGCINLSNESRQKISKCNKGKKRTQPQRKAMSKRLTGSKLSKETRKKISNSHKKVDKSYLIGRKLSEETKLKISKSKKGVSIGVGKILTKEHKKAISNGFKPKFNKKQMEAIMDMYFKKISIRKIAIKFNSNHTTISKYIKTELEKL